VSDDRNIVIHDVSKFYGDVLGVNRVDLEIEPGITSLVGPNGSGKSTLMNLLAGLLRPTRGEISVLGLPVTRPQDLFRRFGYCTQYDSFPRGATGWQFVFSYLLLHGLDRGEAERLTARALERVGLVDSAHRRIGGYSKGMRQRIKLAQAIAHDPELLVLDEPLAGLDPLGRRRVIDVIRAWGREGRSVVVSSHVLHEIELMTSNILLLSNGRILAEGNVHQIRDLIDEHPHTVRITADDPRRLARRLLGYSHVIAMQLQDGAVIAQTNRPDVFYTELTALAAGDEVGAVREVTSPDDNLHAVFSYLVKH
jgi:ABC-2 type transport system ATP-binding protein